ncbi:hypothetical protein PV328_002326 [Microctonus aethiopoides]|uniref:Ribosome-recycling factor, mitochondrial n=2 Tax=Microctonus aethiopoides TaxID=144406 RepID=A0AA39KYE9_9HYME|nr:hypothetical protein PV328_002326 [Microctonus aethiopoides]
MEMYWTALRLSRNLIKCNFNLSKVFYSDICSTKLHWKRDNIWLKTSENQNLSQDLLIKNSRLTINSRSISTSCVMQKSREKGEKKKSGKAQHIDLNEAREVLDIDNFTNQMNNSVDELKDNFIKHLTLRSSAGSIEQVVVNFEGEKYILQDLVQIVRKPKTVVVNAVSFPQAIPQILKALNDSGLNLNPQQDGTTLFIPIPKVTKEHRESLAKNAKAIFIKSRDNIKDIKNKELKALKKKPSLSEDKLRRIQAQLEALCDEYVKKAEGILDIKQKELLRASD